MTNPTVTLLQPELEALLDSRDFRAARDALRAIPPPDIAEFIETLVEDGRGATSAIAFRLLPRAEAAEAFSHLSQDTQEDLISELGDEPAWRLVDAMDPDDRARLIDELPIEVARPILRRLRPESRRETQAILGYPPESVGRLMTTSYVRIKPSWTVARALEHIRHYGEDAETVHYVYVIDAEGRLIDDIHIRQLLLAQPTTPVRDVMDHTFVALRATDDREEAIRELAHYDRSAMPVVDSLGLLVGIVTHDDVTDAAEIETTEDIHMLGGLEALRRPYLDTRLHEMVRKRGGWLAALFVTQLLTIGVMSLFEAKLDQLVVLALFIPLIISSGGNTGTQAASLIVRALALDEVDPKDWVRVLARELGAGMILGVGLGVMGFFCALLLDAVGIADSDAVRASTIGIVVSTAVVGIVIWGTLTGSMLPMLLQRLGADPAASSSPLVATIMDVSGLALYLGIASLVIR